MKLKRTEFANADLYVIKEEQVIANLSLDECIENLRAVLKDLYNKQASNCPRVRVRTRDGAWLHTLRGGWKARGISGGKDYTSIGFDTPAM